MSVWMPPQKVSSILRNLLYPLQILGFVLINEFSLKFQHLMWK